MKCFSPVFMYKLLAKAFVNFMKRFSPVFICFIFCDAGGKPIDSTVPIHIVTNASQLPAEFLEPSPEKQLVIGFDCEGVDLCRHGTLCIMQVFYIVNSHLIQIINIYPRFIMLTEKNHKYLFLDFSACFIPSLSLFAACISRCRISGWCHWGRRDAYESL